MFFSNNWVNSKLLGQMCDEQFVGYLFAGTL
jgi:hypothetical protein